VDPSGLHHELIFFDVGGADELGHHIDRMSKIVRELQKMCVL
jgi:hypothetical protein